MTNITFYKKNNLILGFEVKGHTGKAEKGQDLLCEQISTLAQFAVVAIKNVAKLDAFVQISDGYLKLMLEAKKAEPEKVQFLFSACLESFKCIVLNEGKFAKLEVKNV